MTSFLRPDEQAAQAEIERAQGRDKGVKSALKTGAGLAISAGIMPFLNHYIPVDLAVKGISKVSPELGKFLNKGMKEGLNVQDGLDFIKESFGAKEEKQSKEPAKEKRNIIEQYSPELHQYISDEVNKGRNPLEAGALAQMQEKFKKTIQKLEKDHKTPWSAILQTVFGTQSSPNISPNQKQTTPAQPQPGQPQQSGQGQQALMSILQKLQAARGVQ